MILKNSAMLNLAASLALLFAWMPLSMRNRSIYGSFCKRSGEDGI